MRLKSCSTAAIRLQWGEAAAMGCGGVCSSDKAAVVCSSSNEAAVVSRINVAAVACDGSEHNSSNEAAAVGATVMRLQQCGRAAMRLQ